MDTSTGLMQGRQAGEVTFAGDWSVIDGVGGKIERRGVRHGEVIWFKSQEAEIFQTKEATESTVSVQTF